MGRKLTKSVKKQIINITVLVVLIAVTLLILFLSNRELDFNDIWHFLKSSKIWMLIAAFGCMLLYILFEALSLLVISRTLGHKCKVGSSIVYSAADVYYSAITPSAAGGQPASAYYMVQDGMNTGAATFSLVFNLIAYTGAIIVIGIAAFIIDAIGAGALMFGQFGAFAKILIILGICIQVILLGLFIACMFCHKAVYKCGNALITFFVKIKIIKKEEKWRGKLSGAIEKYKGCLTALHGHKLLFVAVLLLNILQRAAQILIPCFVCSAVSSEVPFFTIFAMQSYVTLGYNSIPLPGGVGAFEYMYLSVFGLHYEKSFILSAMMVTRAISYYISLILSGVITLAYHGHLIRRKKLTAQSTEEVVAEEVIAEENTDAAVTDGNDQEVQPKEITVEDAEPPENGTGETPPTENIAKEQTEDEIDKNGNL